MTPTEVARRSDALYYDCDHTHRRWLCDRIAHLEADMEETRGLLERLCAATECDECPLGADVPCGLGRLIGGGGRD